MRNLMNSNVIENPIMYLEEQGHKITNDYSNSKYRVILSLKEEENMLHQYMTLCKVNENMYDGLEMHIYPSIFDFNCFLMKKETGWNKESTEYKHYYKECKNNYRLHFLGINYGDVLSFNYMTQELLKDIEKMFKETEETMYYNSMVLLGKDKPYREQKELVMKQLNYLLSLNYKE